MHTKGGAHTRRNTQKAACGHRRSHVIKGATGKAVHTEGGAHKRRSVATAGVLLLIYRGGGGLLVYGGITTRGGDGLNRTFGRPTRPAGGTAVLSAGRAGRTFGRPIGRPKVRPYLRPFFWPKQGGGDGLNRTFGRPIGRPKVRRADRYAEPQVRFNPVSFANPWM